MFKYLPITSNLAVVFSSSERTAEYSEASSNSTLLICKKCLMPKFLIVYLDESLISLLPLNHFKVMYLLFFFQCSFEIVHSNEAESFSFSLVLTSCLTNLEGSSFLIKYP